MPPPPTTTLVRVASLSTTIPSHPIFYSSSFCLFHKHFQTLHTLITEKPTFKNFRQWNPFHKREHLFSLLQSCFLPTHFLQLHAQFIRTNFIHHPRLSLKFLSRASRICSSNIAYLSRIFSHIFMPNTSHYNTMIRVFSCNGHFIDGFKFFRMMRQHGVASDYLTVSFCLDGCAKSCGLIEGLQLHGRILVDGYGRDCVLMTSLVELYAFCGQCDDACKVFDEMPHRDVVAYNALICCLMNNKRTRDVLALFESMQTLEGDCRPDDVTCLLLLKACGDLGALEFGRRVEDYVKKHGYGGSNKLNNALVTMYSNCGSVDEAYQTFERIPSKDLVSWSSMIEGLGKNGYGKHAVELFWEMNRTGIAPDGKAITAVLSACSHRGLLDQGVQFFKEMIQKDGTVPSIHHYGCVVDILGRLGSLNEAYDLILSMKVKPDVKIWRTLLLACRMHKNFSLAEQVIEHIVELKAQEVGDYVLLLNTYSLNEKWNKVEELRNFMKEKGIFTNHGCSTIELKGMVHEFVDDDVSHLLKDDIYKMLREILQQLKIAGYVPEASVELHDFDVLEYESVVTYHSEKLAIAFGVLSTSPGTTIRVASNARICGDCHNFCKGLSNVYNRKVIVRDMNKIHHFREGKCSCGDCW